MMRSFPAKLALGLGVVYALVGLVGFAMTGFSGFAHHEGPQLLFFEINPLHNIVHLIIGVSLIAGAMAGAAGLRGVTLVIASVYSLVGVAGFFLIGTTANILALNVADNLLHLGTAAVLFFVAARAPALVRA